MDQTRLQTSSQTQDQARLNNATQSQLQSRQRDQLRAHDQTGTSAKLQKGTGHGCRTLPMQWHKMEADLRCVPRTISRPAGHHP